MKMSHVLGTRTHTFIAINIEYIPYFMSIILLDPDPFCLPVNIIEHRVLCFGFGLLLAPQVSSAFPVDYPNPPFFP